MTDKYDGILAQILQENKGYDGFFDVVFGFLSQKTDFYSNPKKAEETCKISAEKNLRAYMKK